MRRKVYPYILVIMSLLISTVGISQDVISKKAPSSNKKVETVAVIDNKEEVNVPIENAVPDSTENEEENAEELAREDSLALADSLGNDSIALDIPYPQRVTQKIDALLKDDMFKTSQVGIMVWDLDADSLLYAYNEKQLLRTASTMKVVTAIAALDKLGRKYRFCTQIYSTGECDSTSLNGNIYVKGGMDPSFSSYDMDCLVEGVTKMHVDTIRGKLVADVSLKDDKLLGEGWCWDDENPTLTPLLYSKKDTFLKTLRSRLKTHGIVILGNDSIGNTPKKANLLAERYSSLETIMNRMLKASDNLYAEAIYYQIGASVSKPASAKDAQEVEKQVMRKAGLDPSKYRLADGSGLSLYNYLSPECEVKLLRYAYNDKKIYSTLYDCMPIAGVDGTLRKRMKHSSAYDNVHAKTGTVEGVSALTGYCKSPDGHMIAFSIMNQGIQRSQTGRNFQDRVCMALCK